MTASTSADRWQRLGVLLVQRRTALSPRFHNRGAFCEATGLKYRLVYDIEEARRTNFGPSIIAAIEAAYRLTPGAIARFLAGGELETAEGLPPPEPRRDRPLRALEDADEEGLRPYVQSALAEVYAAIGLPFPPGRDLPDLADVPELAGVTGSMAGETLFGDPADQAAWEVRELTAAERVRLIARFRRLRDESEGRTNRNALLTART